MSEQKIDIEDRRYIINVIDHRKPNIYTVNSKSEYQLKEYTKSTIDKTNRDRLKERINAFINNILDFFAFCFETPVNTIWTSILIPLMIKNVIKLIDGLL